MRMFYSTMKEQISDMEEDQVSYRNLHTNMHIRNASSDDIIKIPYKSIIRDYMPFFEKTIISLPLTHEDRARYRFRPKLMSYNLYDTTELWFAILELNNMKSVAEFNLEKDPKVFIPQDFRKILNEVMVLEGIVI